MLLPVLFLAASLSGQIHVNAVMVQVGDFRKFFAGQLDGSTSISNLLTHGDFGVSTLNGLDGELIIKGNAAYRADAYGDITVVPSTRLTPFASVTNFLGKPAFAISSPTSLKAIEERLDRMFPGKDLAIQIDGSFSDVLARAYPPQAKPYPKLASIAPSEPRWHIPDTTGALLGFRVQAPHHPQAFPG